MGYEVEVWKKQDFIEVLQNNLFSFLPVHLSFFMFFCFLFFVCVCVCVCSSWKSIHDSFFLFVSSGWYDSRSRLAVKKFSWTGTTTAGWLVLRPPSISYDVSASPPPPHTHTHWHARTHTRAHTNITRPRRTEHVIEYHLPSDPYRLSTFKRFFFLPRILSHFVAWGGGAQVFRKQRINKREIF